jgi:hypothetical protein
VRLSGLHRKLRGCAVAPYHWQLRHIYGVDRATKFWCSASAMPEGRGLKSNRHTTRVKPLRLIPSRRLVTFDNYIEAMTWRIIAHISDSETCCGSGDQ